MARVPNEPVADELVKLSRREHAKDDAAMLAAAVSGIIDTLKRVLDRNPETLLKSLTRPMVEKAANEAISRWIIERARIAARGDRTFDELGAAAPLPEFLT